MQKAGAFPVPVMRFSREYPERASAQNGRITRKKGRVMFRKGSRVAHPTHGAGVVIDVREIAVAGSLRRYYHIDLANGNGMLMLPVEQAEEAGLRPVADPDLILDVLADDPQELSDNYRTRQTRAARKINSGDVKKVAEVLRDLAWRGLTGSLSSGDASLKSKAQKLLASELAVQQEAEDVERASERLRKTLRRTLKAHNNAAQTA
jgi:CarD family transcriptional regulator